MSDMPRVSVTICCYNSERYLDETIDSVVNQSFSDWELVIVNDGSQDGTDEIVSRRIRAGLPIVYASGPKRGLAAARNMSFELARGELIALLDHDDICLPERLERQVASADSHPEVDLFFSNTEHFLNDGTIVQRQFDGFPINPCDLDLSAGKALDQLLIHGCFIDTESVLVRRKILEKIGGFNEAYRFIVDYEWFLRAGKCSAMLGDPQVLARWRVHSGQSSQVMSQIALRETVDLLGKWLRDDAISLEARRMIGVYLAITHLRCALILAGERRLGKAMQEMYEALAIGPDPRRVVSRVWQRLRWKCGR